MTGKVDALTFGPAGHVRDENEAINSDCMMNASNATTNMHKSPNVEEVSKFIDLEILIHNIDDVTNLCVHELRVNGAGNDYVNSIANINAEFFSKMETLVGYGTTLPDMVSPSDPIVRSVDINTKPKSYAGAAGESAKDQPTVSNFRPLVADLVFDGVNIAIPHKVIEKNNWAKHGLTRIMMNNKETIRVEYEWKPPRCYLCKIFGHVHDHCPNKVASPPIVTNSNVVTPIVKKTNDGFQTVGKKKKRNNKSKSTNGGQFAGHSVKKTLIDEEEDMENVYDESANLFQNTKPVETPIIDGDVNPNRSIYNVGNKMHKASPLPEVCTAIEEKKKELPVKDRWQLH
nr:zinc knuckle CX2CX4HX4C [Tanacetum cinerariifolium]